MQIGSSAVAAAPSGAAPWPNQKSWDWTADADPPAQAQSAAPAATEESLVGNVQLLQDNAMAQEMYKLPEPIRQKKLTQPEMAKRFRGKAQVIKGSSLFLCDSSFNCRRTHDEYGKLLMVKRSKYTSCEESLEREMARYDRKGLFFYECSMGGKVEELTPLIVKYWINCRKQQRMPD